MKYLKILGIAAVAAMAFMAFAVSSASATTLEETGVTKNSSVTITASLKSGTEAVLGTTGGVVGNFCSTSHVHGNTTSADGVHNKYTGTRLTGPITSLTFENCDVEKVVVHKPGNLFVEHEAGTTHGTVSSEEAEVTVPTTLGFTANCKTGTGSKLGTLTGVAAGQATLHINAVLNCGFLLPSATWVGTYVVTSPHGLGVSA